MYVVEHKVDKSPFFVGNIVLDNFFDGQLQLVRHSKRFTMKKASRLCSREAWGWEAQGGLHGVDETAKFV
jgi:hypothetical protein